MKKKFTTTLIILMLAIIAIAEDFNFVNIDSVTASSWGTGDAGSINLYDSTELRLSGTAYKRITNNYNVTENTVLEFDFKSNDEGYLHGITVTNETTYDSTIFFQLHGTDEWGRQGFNNYTGSDWVHYKINIGNVVTGNMNYICFINEMTSMGDGSCSFRNITMHEGDYINWTSIKSSASERPIKNEMYKNSTDKNTYIYNGSEWDKIAGVDSNSIDNYHIKNNAITSTKIANYAVGNNQISTNAITSDKVATGAITSSDIADATITGTDIALGTISGNNIGTATIYNSNIAPGTITSTTIGNGQVSTEDIADEAVTTAKLRDRNVTAGKIATGLLSGINVDMVDGYHAADLMSRAAQYDDSDLRNEIEKLKKLVKALNKKINAITIIKKTR